MTCGNPAPGHQYMATCQNMMGGNKKGITKMLLPSQAGRQHPNQQLCVQQGMFYQAPQQQMMAPQANFIAQQGPPQGQFQPPQMMYQNPFEYGPNF